MPESVQHLVLWLIPVAPLAAAVVTAILGPKLLRGRSHLPCWFGLAVAMVCALVVLFSIVPGGFGPQGNSPAVASGYQWMDVGGIDVGASNQQIFEQIMKIKYPNLRLDKSGDGEYVSAATGQRWIGWQMRQVAEMEGWNIQ